MVSPAVRSLLTQHQIPFAREVAFELLDVKGNPVVRGRFDIVFRNPLTKELVFPELKGDRLNSLTKGQKVYVPLFESTDGARARILSTGDVQGGDLYLAAGREEQVHAGSFLRVGTPNLRQFTVFVEEMATGKRPTNVYYGPEGLIAFHSQAEFDTFLVTEKQMDIEPTSPAAPTSGDKPLKPSAPVEAPNPLHDPPPRKPAAGASADPTAGPPGYGRTGPKFKPQPYDPDRPPKPGSPVPARPAQEPAAPLVEPGGVTEGRAEPVAPIEAPAPVGAQQEARGRLEGTGLAILAAQVHSLRGAEVQKALDRFDELRREIERNHAAGIGVTVTLIAEIPDNFDPFEWAVGIGDSSQVVYYYDMYLSPGDVPQRDPTAPPPESAGMNPAGQSDYRQHLGHAREGFQFGRRDLYLPAPAHSLSGTYRAVAIGKLQAGSRAYAALDGLHRTLLITLDGRLVMFDDDSTTYWRTTVEPNTDFAPPGKDPTLTALFERTIDPAQSIDSSFTVSRSNDGKILGLWETARGHEGVAQHAWTAEIAWLKTA